MQKKSPAESDQNTEQSAPGVSALIERLSRAAGSTFELNAAIARLDWYREQFGDCADDEVPDFCGSIDAAMMLVPEGYAIRDWMVWPGHPVELTILETFFDKGRHWHNSDTQRWAVKASTPAIALCIAALSTRTRTATGKSGAEDHSIQKAGIDAEQSVTKLSPANGGEG